MNVVPVNQRQQNIDVEQPHGSNPQFFAQVVDLKAVHSSLDGLTFEIGEPVVTHGKMLGLVWRQGDAIEGSSRHWRRHRLERVGEDPRDGGEAQAGQTLRFAQDAFGQFKRDDRGVSLGLRRGGVNGGGAVRPCRSRCGELPSWL